MIQASGGWGPHKAFIPIFMYIDHLHNNLQQNHNAFPNLLKIICIFHNFDIMLRYL